MTKEQFISLLRTPSTINLNMVRGLEEITERFPYFQNAHLLLAKQYQGHQNIRYESYLRKAAAYASDRRVLYDLIKLEPQEVIHIEPEVEIVKEEVRNVGPRAEVVMEEVRSVEAEAEGVKEKVREEVRNIESQAEEVREGVRNVGPEADVVRGKVMEEVRNVGSEAEGVREGVRNTVDEEIRDADVDAVELRDAISDEENVEAGDTERNTTIAKSDENAELILEEEENGSVKVSEDERDIKYIQILDESENVREKIKDDEPAIHDISTSEEDQIVPEKIAVTNPQEIIAKRLRELAKSKEEVVAVPAKTPDEQPVLKSAPVDPPDPITKEPINEEPAEPEFVRVRREQREPREPRDPKLKVEEQHSFLEWLKLKDIPVIPTERVSEYFKKEDVADGDLHKPGEQLIDRFIKTEPRIVPARSEFYSPGNMARQSAVDHEDLISETLARIYAQQGNIPKAIDAYKRLSLKIPEKSSYFAALIKDLEQKEQS